MDIAYECIFTLIVSSDGPGRQGIFFIVDSVFIINNGWHDYTVFNGSRKGAEKREEDLIIHCS